MIKLKEDIIDFYFDKAKLINNFYEFKKYGDIFYPLKTNSNINILKALKPHINRNNNGFLISHPSHFYMLKKLGIPAKRMCLINVLAEDDFVLKLYNKGVRYFTFDNMQLLIEFAKYADLSHVKIAVRLSITEVFKDKFSHLGGNKDECIEIIKFLKVNKCSEYGISFYLQRELFTTDDCLNTMLDYICLNFKNCNMSFVNIGGAKEYQEIDPAKLAMVKKELKINKIILEPGRFLSGNCVDMKTRIIKVKEIENLKTIIIKNGIYSGFVDVLLYNKNFEIYFETKQDGKIRLTNNKVNDNDFEFIICGGSSDSGDRLGKFYLDSKYKDELVVNAKFYVKNVGAYFEEFFMPLGGDLVKKYNLK